MENKLIKKNNIKRPVILINALASSVGGNKRFYSEFIQFASKTKKYLFIFLKNKNDDFGTTKNKSIIFINAQIYKKNSINLPGGRFRSLKRFIWENLNLKSLIKKYNVNLYFTRAHQIPKLPSYVKCICAISSILPLIKTHNQPKLWIKIRCIIQKHFLLSAIKRSKVCICISNFCKNILIQNKDISKNTRIVVIRNGLTNTLKPVLVHKSSFVKLLTVGNFYKYKQYELLLKIVLHLQSRHFVKLTIIGNPYDDSYYKVIKNQITNLKMTSIVRILQNLDPSNIAIQYKKHDLFISSSLYENSPIALLDALQFGLPCLVSRIPAHREILGCQNQTMFFSPYSINEALKKVTLLLNPDYRVKNQKVVLRRKKLFSWQTTFKSLFTEFERLHVSGLRN